MDKNLAQAQALLNDLTFHILDKIPFCQLLGLRMDEMSLDHVIMSFDKKPELVGNFVSNILHGGVISSVIDNAGGAMAMASIFRKHAGDSFDVFKESVSKVSTIDLRVDYLQPGRGEHFKATAKPLRVGKRICVSSVELHNEHHKLIAVGTGAYLIG